MYFLGYDSNGYETHKNVNQDSAARVKALFNYLIKAPSPETDTTTPLITEKNFATNASITVGEKATDDQGNVLKDSVGHEKYNASISFNLEIEKSKLTEAFRCSLENFGSFDYIDKQDDDAIRHVTILPLYALSLLRSR